MKLRIILFRIYRYLTYWLYVLDEHSLHSPSIFQLYNDYLKPEGRQAVYDQSIEQLRYKLQSSKDTIGANTHGALSSMSIANAQLVRKIAESGVSGQNTSELLVNLIRYSKARKVLELGTSLGLNAAYISRSTDIQSLVTVEGNVELIQKAQSNFKVLGLDKIQLINQDIDQFFENNSDQFDLVFIDANHSYEATLRYFHQSIDTITREGIIVLDDINWSPGMRRAWDAICAKGNHLTIENDKIGIVFANEKLDSARYILRF